MAGVQKERGCTIANRLGNMSGGSAGMLAVVLWGVLDTCRAMAEC